MLAFPLGGIPYFHLGSCNNFSCPQSLILKGGFARIKSAFNPLCKSFWNVSSANFPISPFKLLIAKFIFANFHVVGFFSCPYIAKSCTFPWCLSINFVLCTNIPPEPQHGSYILPLYGSIISTIVLTRHAGV